MSWERCHFSKKSKLLICRHKLLSYFLTGKACSTCTAVHGGVVVCSQQYLCHYKKCNWSLKVEKLICILSMGLILTRLLYTRHNTQHNKIQYNTIQYNSMIQYVAIQYNTIKCNAIQYNRIKYNTTQHNTMQYNTIQ